MKVLVTGSREWADGDVITAALKHCGATIVVHGNQRGADMLAKLAAMALRIEQRPYDADWRQHGRKAGPLRNQRMLDEEHQPEEPIALALAFPTLNSIGTWDMCERLDRAGIAIRVLGHTGIRRRDTPENRAFWKFVQDTADECRRSRPSWARDLDRRQRRGPSETTERR